MAETPTTCILDNLDLPTFDYLDEVQPISGLFMSSFPALQHLHQTDSNQKEQKH